MLYWEIWLFIVTVEGNEYALFYILRSAEWYFPTDVSGQSIDLIFKGQLKMGPDRLSQNVGQKLPFYAEYNPKRAHISYTPQRRPEIVHAEHLNTL